MQASGGCEDVERGGERAGQSPDGFRHGDGICVGGMPGANNAGHETRVHGEGEHLAANEVDELLRVVQRKVTVKGSGGVVATVVVTARCGKVRMSIQPPFTWDTIMEPGMVEALIRRWWWLPRTRRRWCGAREGLAERAAVRGRERSDCLPKSLRFGSQFPFGGYLSYCHCSTAQVTGRGVTVAACACAVSGIPPICLVPACWAAACY